MKPALVILAGGASTRLEACKALVPITPRCALELLLENGAVLDDAAPLVVTGKDHEAIVRALERMSDARAKEMCAVARPVIVLNAEWERGRTGSVVVAATVRRGMDLCLAPVDVPLVDSSVFDALVRRWHSAGAPERGWLAPRNAERFGHPIVVGRALLADMAEQFARFGADTPLRVLREKAEPIFSVDVDDAAVLDDLDGPDDLRTLRARFSH